MTILESQLHRLSRIILINILRKIALDALTGDFDIYGQDTLIFEIPKQVLPEKAKPKVG